MIPASFEYVAPKSLAEATAFLRRTPGARALAGGHDLLTQLKLRRLTATLLVDLNHVKELRGIHVHHDSGGALATLKLGAMVTCRELTANSDVRQNAAALVDAANSVGDAQTRNASTLGGSLANGDPASDLAAAVLALGGRLEIEGAGGMRTVESNNFFLGAFATVLEPGDLLVAIELPAPAAHSASAYVKFKNPVNGYPLCGVAAAVTLGQGGAITQARIAVTGLSAHPRRLPQLEQQVTGQTAEQAIAHCIGVADGLHCITDLFAGGDYRAHLADVLAAQAITAACKRAAA